MTEALGLILVNLQAQRVILVFKGLLAHKVLQEALELQGLKGQQVQREHKELLAPKEFKELLDPQAIQALQGLKEQLELLALQGPLALKVWLGPMQIIQL